MRYVLKIIIGQVGLEVTEVVEIYSSFYKCLFPENKTFFLILCY
jgi:hypothetical protein